MMSIGRQWQFSAGIAGNFHPEWLAIFAGISGRFEPEYALRNIYKYFVD